MRVYVYMQEYQLIGCLSSLYASISCLSSLYACICVYAGVSIDRLSVFFVCIYRLFVLFVCMHMCICKSIKGLMLIGRLCHLYVSIRPKKPRNGT